MCLQGGPLGRGFGKHVHGRHRLQAAGERTTLTDWKPSLVHVMRRGWGDADDGDDDVA